MQNIYVFEQNSTGLCLGTLVPYLSMKRSLTYKNAGVDINEGERFVKRISPMVKKTFRPEVITDLGLFSALFRINTRKYKEPVLVSGTDGVGTKLKIAFMMDRHDTVGIDLVAMCVNDILTSGAEPLFFLDYFATGRLRAERASEVIRGIVKGCRQSGCALIGGETAEMPDFYQRGEYDLSGFAVGIADRRHIIDGRGIRKGDVVIGIASNGLHSNGYSLVRKLFFNVKKMRPGTYVPELRTTLGKELLKPTRIYAKAFSHLKGRVPIKGMAHITGGGIPGNLPRILPPGVHAVVRAGSWRVPRIFTFIQKTGNIEESEMKKTFNMGVGFAIVVSESTSHAALTLIKKAGYKAFIIGNIEKGGGGVRYT